MEQPIPFTPNEAVSLAHRSTDFEALEKTDNEGHRASTYAQLELSLEVTNLTSQPISITTRHGERYTLPPRLNQMPIWRPGVYFNSKRRISNDVQVELPYRADLDDSKTGLRLTTSLQQQEPNRSARLDHATRRAMAASVLTFTELKQVGGRVYLDDLDIVVSLTQPNVIDHHPYSRNAIEQYMRLRWSDEASFMLRMYIVDNDARLSVRFFNFNGKIFKVPVLMKPGVKNGVYVIHPPAITVGNAPVGPYDVQWLTMEQAEKDYNLYRTIDDAETFGFNKDALANETLRNKRLDDRARLYFNDEEREYNRARWEAEREREAEQRAWQREQWAQQTEAERIAEERKREDYQRKVEAEERKRRHDEHQREYDVEQLRLKHAKEIVGLIVSFSTALLGVIAVAVKATKGK